MARKQMTLVFEGEESLAKITLVLRDAIRYRTVLDNQRQDMRQRYERQRVEYLKKPFIFRWLFELPDVNEEYYLHIWHDEELEIISKCKLLLAGIENGVTSISIDGDLWRRIVDLTNAVNEQKDEKVLSY